MKIHISSLILIFPASILLAAVTDGKSMGGDRERIPIQKILQYPEPSGGQSVAINPPTFRWPKGITLPVKMTLSSIDSELDEPKEFGPIPHYFFRPRDPLLPGRYQWNFRDANGHIHEGGSFEVSEGATAWEVPQISDLLKAIPKTHPRIHIRPAEAQDLRARLEKADPQFLENYLAENADVDKTPIPDISGALAKGQGNPRWAAANYGLEMARGMDRLCLPSRHLIRRDLPLTILMISQTAG